MDEKGLAGDPCSFNKPPGKFSILRLVEHKHRYGVRMEQGPKMADGIAIPHRKRKKSDVIFALSDEEGAMSGPWCRLQIFFRFGARQLAKKPKISLQGSGTCDKIFRHKSLHPGNSI